MGDCPNCGESMDGAYCWACGTQIDDAVSATDDAVSASTNSSGADDSQESDSGTARDPSAGAGAELEPTADQPPSGTDTDRRSLLRYGAVGAALLGGWYVFVRDSSSDPEDVVADFYAAMDAGDVDGANALLHEHSPEGELTESELEHSDEFTLTVESTVERTVDAADETVVEAEVRVDEEGEESETHRYELVLRKQDGDWRLYEMSFDGTVD